MTRHKINLKEVTENWFYNKDETYNQQQINNKIQNLQNKTLNNFIGFEAKEVTELPEEGEDGVIYLIITDIENERKIYDVYIYTQDDWSYLGNGNIDLDFFGEYIFDTAEPGLKGLMSGEDKTKLDTISCYANNTVFEQKLSEGTKIGTITIDNNQLDIYCETNTHNPIDDTLSESSTNAVENKILKKELDKKSNINHTHLITDTENLQNKLNEKAQLDHTHNEYASKQDLNYLEEKTDNDYTILQNQIDLIPRFQVKKVTELPEIGEEAVIYFIDKTGKDNDYFNEYIWIEDKKQYEFLGTTQIDLTNYYTKQEIDNQLIEKADKTTVTTSTNGLMSSSDKTKLDGIDQNANKTIVDSSLSSSSTNPVQNQTLYKELQNKAGLYTASTSENGLMSASDKTKINSIESGANKTTVDASLSRTSTNPLQNKVITEKIRQIPYATSYGTITADKNDIVGSVKFVTTTINPINFLFITDINLRFTDTTNKNIKTGYIISDAPIVLDGFNEVETGWRVIGGYKSGSQGVDFLLRINENNQLELRMTELTTTSIAYGDAIFVRTK